MGRVMLLRHGETEWSRVRRHTGRTDIPLTERGEAEARGAAPFFAGLRPELVLVSPLQRARRTAELAGVTGLGAPVEVCDDLVEWDYGDAEGRTTADVRQDVPGWDLWRDGAPGGETHDDVRLRLDRVVDRLEALVHPGGAGPGQTLHDLEGPVPLVVAVAHGHSLRALTARWLRLEVAAGSVLPLRTAGVGVLGYEHERRALSGWNWSASG